MIGNKKDLLKEKIIEEMTADFSNALEKNFDLAKKLIKITNEGKISVIFKNDLTGEEKILLYLIGKVYAEEAEISQTHEVDSKELMDELGFLKGSFYPIIKRLRDKKRINQTRKGKYTLFSIPSNQIERILTKINRKLNL